MNCSVDCFGTERYMISIGKECLASSSVGDNVYIGIGAYVMPGDTIENNCIIGSMALVVKDSYDNSVAVGFQLKQKNQ